MDNNWLLKLDGQNQIEKMLKLNEYTATFGLVLSTEDAKLLASKRCDALKEQQRVEFGEGILPKLIFTFCDSCYIDQNNYVETIGRLQEIFYQYKNETMDELGDDELLESMREAFDGECEGSLEFLEETAMERLARKLRKRGYGALEEDYED